MSAKKIFPKEIKKEDISAIPQLRNAIINLLNSDKENKKAAHVLSLWLQQKDKSQKS